MQYLTLNNGIKMPILGFGTYLIPPEETKEITTTKMRKKYKMKTLDEKTNKSKKNNKKLKG